jgi:hypothetical protein
MSQRFNEELKKSGDNRIDLYKFGGWISDTDKDRLIQLLCTHFNPEEKYSVAEIGIFQGGDALIILHALPNCHFHALDNWLGGPASPGFANIREGFVHAIKSTNTENRVTIHDGDSLKTAPNWDIELDLCIVDGNHDEPYVTSDITNMSKWVKVGGYLLVDDYDMLQVKSAVDKLLLNNSNWQKIEVTEQIDKLIMFKRI